VPPGSRSVPPGQDGRPQRLGHRLVDGVVLVVGGRLLDQRPAAVVLENDEIAHQIEKAPLLEDAGDEHGQLGHARILDIVARDGSPGQVPLGVGRQCAQPGVGAVGDDQGGVIGQQRRDLGLVGLELLEGFPDVGLLVGGVLQLDDRQRQAVDEQDDVGPADVGTAPRGCPSRPR
jgi:hypothetical protein